MKITDTLKQIIEKIEPYMDKTLSEWCLFIKNKFSKEKYIFTFCWNTKYWKTTYNCYWTHPIYDYLLDYRDNYSTIETKNFEIMLNEEIKILWHLDITSVLKYIESNIAWHTNYSNAWGKDYFYFWYYEKDNQGEIVEYDFKIPNKPLHLYTEEELKHLLEILNNIENND